MDMGTGTREGLLPGEVTCNSVRFVCGQVGVKGYFCASVNKEPVIPSTLFLSLVVFSVFPVQVFWLRTRFPVLLGEGSVEKRSTYCLLL